MVRFRYEAVKRDGAVLTGSLHADGERDALRQLARRDLVPVAMHREAAAGPTPRRRPLRRRRPDYTLLVEELAIMASAGIPIGEAVESLASGLHDPDLAGQCARLTTALAHGEPLANAFRTAMPNLPAYVIGLIEAGSSTGELSGALRDAARQMRFEGQIRQDLHSALVYPMVLTACGAGAVLFILLAVVPNFQGIIGGRLDQLPWLSRAVFAASDMLIRYWWALAALAVLLLAALARGARRRGALGVIGSRLPVLAPWLQATETGRWVSMLATLLGHHVPLMQAMPLARSAVRIGGLARQLEHVERAIRGGAGLAAALSDYTALEPSAITLIAVGERTGRLPETLLSLSELMESARRIALKRVLLLFEPAAILFIGGTIGVFAVAIILAITSVNEFVL